MSGSLLLSARCNRLRNPSTLYSSRVVRISSGDAPGDGVSNEVYGVPLPPEYYRTIKIYTSVQTYKLEANAFTHPTSPVAGPCPLRIRRITSQTIPGLLVEKSRPINQFTTR